MNKCPRCGVALIRVMYEHRPVHQCRQCQGHLVSNWKLEGIKKNAAKSPEELKAEAAAEFKVGETARAKCPHCFLYMARQVIDLFPLQLFIDMCEPCELVWLDGGELAILQLVHEASEKHLDARNLQRRMRELYQSPERLEKLERDLARAKGPPWLGDDVLEDVLDGLLRVILRGLPVGRLR